MLATTTRARRVAGLQIRVNDEHPEDAAIQHGTGAAASRTAVERVRVVRDEHDHRVPVLTSLGVDELDLVGAAARADDLAASP